MFPFRKLYVDGFESAPKAGDRQPCGSSSAVFVHNLPAAAGLTDTAGKNITATGPRPWSSLSGLRKSGRTVFCTMSLGQSGSFTKAEDAAS